MHGGSIHSLVLVLEWVLHNALRGRSKSNPVGGLLVAVGVVRL